MQFTNCNTLLQIRSLSLSLDSLLDYSDKDLEESTFEVCSLVLSTCVPSSNLYCFGIRGIFSCPIILISSRS